MLSFVGKTRTSGFLGRRGTDGNLAIGFKSAEVVLPGSSLKQYRPAFLSE
jgi:hypothetical protein